jgi:DNA-binding SARP family transcriptional activator/tetratricopeptide (TPR) repeat protein
LLSTDERGRNGVEFRLLGAVEVRTSQGPLTLGPPQRRAVVAALLVDVGRPVPPTTIMQRVWDEAPSGARRALHAHVARLRHALSGTEQPAPLLLQPGGYVLDVPADQVDLHRFRRLIAAARDPGQEGRQRCRLLEDALGMWRGLPLSELAGSWAERVRQGLLRQRVDAAVLLCQTSLQIGDHLRVVDLARDLLVDHPLAEPLYAALMTALAGADRPAEALDHYAIARAALRSALGVEPGTELQRLHRAILRGGVVPVGATVPAPTPSAVAAPPYRDPQPSMPVPAQLPADIAVFTGRVEQLQRLDGVLALSADASAATAVTIAAVTGTAGVGKTALAVHWAHRVAHQFPDGQLHVNLRGFVPVGTPMTPEEAVRGFLEALGVAPQRIPRGTDAQVALYRSRLAGRKVLVLLDNARDADQVRPLLPGAPGCLVVVTSRNQLTGLVAANGAHPIALDLFTEAEARELLALRLGAHRLAAEPAAVEDLVASSARLPLALAIVVAHVAIRPAQPLAVLADELHRPADPLDAFSDEDLSANVRAVFSSSYRALSHPAARLFRLIGLHPGPDISLAAAASLAGLAPARTSAALAELARAHLVAEPVPGRYTCHDLLRAYAAERSTVDDPEPDRRQALHRLLDHYLRTAHTAAQRMDPTRDPVELPAAQPGVTPIEAGDSDEALTVLAADHPALLAAVDLAARSGFDAYACQLPWALGTYFHRQGHWPDMAATQRTGVAAAERLGDRLAQARCHRALARACMLLGRHDQAAAHHQNAFDLYGAVGDQSGQAHCRIDLAELLMQQNRHREALQYAQQAADLSAAVGNLAAQARNLNCVGWCHAQLGQYEQAVDTCRQALILLHRTGDGYGAAATLDSLGFAYHQLGQHDDATAHYRQALDLRRSVGDRYGEAETLNHLGDTHQATGNTDAAREDWQHALAILNELSHPDADDLRDKLHNTKHRHRATRRQP